MAKKKTATIKFIECGDGQMETEVIFNPPTSRKNATGVHLLVYSILDHILKEAGDAKVQSIELAKEPS